MKMKILITENNTDIKQEKGIKEEDEEEKQ